MHLATPTLHIRATTSSSSSSSSSSDACLGKNADSNACEKPSSENGLEIGLGVGLPMALILAVLGVFMYRNYRKEKREAMEHDPDFDENGDATALPDFPAFTKEDPFLEGASVNKLANNGAYPIMMMNNRSMSELRSISTRGMGEKEFVDGFVLPYQHQIGNKASLDEFARHLVDYKNTSPQVSSADLPNSQPYHTRPSPQKSTTLRQAHRSPVKERKGASDYTNIPNTSNTLLNDSFHTKEQLDSSMETKSSQSQNDNFAVKYENELRAAINTTLPSTSRPAEVSERAAHTNDVSDIESVDDSDDDDEGHVMQVDVLSPFEDKNRVDDLAATHPSAPKVCVNGDFDFSSNSIDLEESRLKPAKEPRMSAFNMLQNVSDDEGENVELEQNMTREQEEELARMKSVYKVYFDRANSVKSPREDGALGKFQADPAQPLPSIDIDNLKINSELKGDTSYDKRKTTTSSIYEQAPIFEGENNTVHPYQQFNAPPAQYQQPYPQQNPQQLQQQYQQPPKQDLTPLKSLPNASDIRHSTIETFTDYQRRAKLTSPTMRQQQGYFDDAIGSPYMSSQGSFPSPQGTPDMGNLPPTLRSNSIGGSVPSPTQLSRTSVVMLNPVTEITSHRKFKPAGSLPSGMSGPTNAAYLNDELASSGDDLIPGNRKSAVRRMMNSNF